MDKLQILCFFISGFLVSRLVVAVRLPERIVGYAVGRRHITIGRVTFYLIALSAFLSCFIPNAITALTMLPVLELFRQAYEKNGENGDSIPTLLALSVIYGSNIGGMGTITGTPANGIYITFLEAHKVPGAASIQFASWLLWAMPLVVCLVVMAWLVIMAVLRPWRSVKCTVNITLKEEHHDRHRQAWAIFLTLVYFASSFLFSSWLIVSPHRMIPILIVTAAFTMGFLLFLFFVPVRCAGTDRKRPLLAVTDCYSGLPLRGFLFVGVAFGLGITAYLLGLHIKMAEWLTAIVPARITLFAFFLSVALMTSFATEILSNTAVQIGMFVFLLPLSLKMGFPPITVLLVATLSCNCAFMTPIATGVNGLVFGGVRKVALWRMLVVGTVMNITAALLISFWMYRVVPW